MFHQVNFLLSDGAVDLPAVTAWPPDGRAFFGQDSHLLTPTSRPNDARHVVPCLSLSSPTAGDACPRVTAASCNDGRAGSIRAGPLCRQGRGLVWGRRAYAVLSCCSVPSPQIEVRHGEGR